MHGFASQQVRIDADGGLAITSPLQWRSGDFFSYENGELTEVEQPNARLRCDHCRQDIAGGLGPQPKLPPIAGL